MVKMQKAPTSHASSGIRAGVRFASRLRRHVVVTLPPSQAHTLTNLLGVGDGLDRHYELTASPDFPARDAQVINLRIVIEDARVLEGIKESFREVVQVPLPPIRWVRGSDYGYALRSEAIGFLLEA